jgi:hypothetical protein
LLSVSYTILLFLQTVHIFEEIAARAYELVGALNKYLVVASLLLLVSYSALILMLVGVQLGYFVAVFGGLLALGNGIIHWSERTVLWRRPPPRRGLQAEAVPGFLAGFRWGSWEGWCWCSWPCKFCSRGGAFSQAGLDGGAPVQQANPGHSDGASRNASSLLTKRMAGIERRGGRL